MKDLEYVLRFALDVIEENELENTKNSDNWILGEAIEEQLSLFGVVRQSEQLKYKETPTLEVDLNSKQAQEYRNTELEKILNTPCKTYLFDGENYIEIKP